MSGGYLQTLLFSFNRPEPLRQASLLMVLASSIGDGESLTESLQVHANDCGSPWADRVQSLRLLLEQGQSLSSALSSSAGLLPDSTLIAIRVAEQNGTLPDVLVDEANRLMAFTTGENQVSQSAFGTLIWLSAVITVATCLVTFIMIFIVPKMKRVFEDFGVELPGPTQLLISTADVAVYGWPLLVPQMLMLGVALFGLSVWAGILKLSRGLLPFCQHWPRYWMPDVLRMLSFTVVAGKPLSDTLHCITRELQPGRAAMKISGLRTLVDQGTDCVAAMRQLRLLTSREASFLEASERTNHLDWAFQHLSRAIARSRLRWVDRATLLMQPVAVACVGVVVGFIVVSLFYPLVALLESLT